MKKLIAIMAIAGLGLSAFAGAPKKAVKKAETYTVSATESKLNWHAKKVVGEHFGVVNFKGGSLVMNNGKLVGGEFTVDMPTLDATDLQGEWHDKLVGHLKSDDFFSTEKHKTSVMKIKSVSAGTAANTYNVVADLTIKGITKEVKFVATVEVNGNTVTAKADFNVDRTAYDIRYGSSSFFEGLGDKAIDNMFNIKVSLVAKK